MIVTMHGVGGVKAKVHLLGVEELLLIRIVVLYQVPARVVRLEGGCSTNLPLFAICSFILVVCRWLGEQKLEMFLELRKRHF